MAKYTLEQLKGLPAALQDHYFDAGVEDRYFEEIFPLLDDGQRNKLKELVLDVYFKKQTPNGFVSVLREFIPDEKVYKEVLVKVLGYDFLPIADELEADILDIIKKNGGDPLVFRTKVPVSDVIEEIKKKITADIPHDERMARRLDNILKSKVTNARTDAQVEEMLTGNPKTSGIGLGKEKAAEILLFANEEVKKLEQRNVVVESDEEYEREEAVEEAVEEEAPVSAPQTPALEAAGESAVPEAGEELAAEEGQVQIPTIEKKEGTKRESDVFGAEDKQEIEAIADELGPARKTMAQKAVEITIETLADEALDASGVPFDEDMHKRFRYAVDLFHRDLRDELETRSKLTMATASGGLGLSDEQAEKVMTLLKTRIGEYRQFMATKASAEKERYVAERNERESSRSAEEERRRKAALDKRFRELTGKDAPLPDTDAGAGTEPAAPPEPKRVAVIAEEEAGGEKPEVQTPVDMLDTSTVEQGSGPAARSAPPEALPVAGPPLDEKESDLEELRKDMAEPSEEQLLVGSAVGAVSEGGYRQTEEADREKSAAAAQAPGASKALEALSPPPKAAVPKPAVAPPQRPPVAKPMPSAPVRPIMPPSAGKPVVSDIKFTPKLTGPVEELRQITLIDFRRLSKDPKEATLKIKDKLDLLAQQSYELKQEGVKAWQESPANKAYLDVLKESLEGKPVADVLKERQTDKDALTRQEFETLMELNRVIRFE